MSRTNIVESVQEVSANICCATDLVAQTWEWMYKQWDECDEVETTLLTKDIESLVRFEWKPMCTSGMHKHSYRARY
mgnify:CR=1 FL=1